MAREPLSISHPEIAALWDWQRNGANLSPDIESATSRHTVAWLCPSNPRHFYYQRIDVRVKAKKGCLVCRLENGSLAAQYPEIAKQWHPTKNGSLEPHLVAAKSDKKYWWQCDKNPEHSWHAPVHNRTFNNTGCPYCSGASLDQRNSLAARYPDIAAQWDSNGNGDLTPDQVSWSARKKVVWRCERNHTWTTRVSNRTSAGANCPKCTGRYLTEEYSLQSRFPEVAAEWHPTKNRMLIPKDNAGTWKSSLNSHLAPEDKNVKKNRRLTPADVAAYSREEVWWLCSKNPKHTPYKAVINDRTSCSAGCPLCLIEQKMMTSLEAMYPTLARYFHPSRNHPVTPDQIYCRAKESYWWRCFKSADHLYSSSVKEMLNAYVNKRTICQVCRKEEKENGKPATGQVMLRANKQVR